MVKIIKFREMSGEVPFSEDDFQRLNLGELLKRSARLGKKKYEEIGHLKITRVKSKADACTFFEGLLSGEIVRRKNIRSEYFFCANYISHLLASFVDSFPDSLIAFDYEKSYQETGKTECLKKGADICFLICTVFDGRKSWRLTSPRFYHEKGISLYYHFYLNEGKDIAFHMSSEFEEMVDITREAIPFES